MLKDDRSDSTLGYRLDTARSAVVVTGGPATVTGDPVDGVRLTDGTVIPADLGVTCCGEVPNTDWLAGTGLAGSHGVAIDPACATAVPGVFAAGDVSCLQAGTRTPFWSTAVAQGKAAAASALTLDPASRTSSREACPADRRC
ncbi:FAD-dependent oxidoreductase [Amycolatopsis sp. NPDC049691]|uniref:FAD-dependent oxidoreductase n=1 Tax=Amycolatopsis sp. NPDC049691 TaxID=3155155 RepID=UPI0034183A16